MAFETSNIDSYSAPNSRRTLASAEVYSKFGKRAVDLFLVVLMAPILLPIIGILWALTKSDGGPGFFVQDRVGLGGQVFSCYKLRTMVMDADKVLQDLCDSDPEIAREWHENQKLAVDPRVTKAGKFLRATSLDELPQFLNVLKGDMSFVGPRPFMTSQDDMYRQAGGKAYYHMRPGITGPWQIEGRGETTFIERIGFDEHYLDNISLRKDVSYILKTVGVVFNRTGH